jgi:hypothetical protein
MSPIATFFVPIGLIGALCPLPPAMRNVSTGRLRRIARPVSASPVRPCGQFRAPSLRPSLPVARYVEVAIGAPDFLKNRIGCPCFQDGTAARPSAFSQL